MHNQQIPRTKLKTKSQIWINVVESRDLGVRSSFPQPYCVVEFEKNEFVSREGKYMQVKENPAYQQLMHQQKSMNSIAKSDSSYGHQSMQSDENIGSFQKYNKSQHDFLGTDPSNHITHFINPIWKHEANFDVATSDGEIAISVWDRSSVQQGKPESFLGFIKIRPPRINGKMHDSWFKLFPRQWNEKVSGDIRIQLMYKTVPAKPLSSNDFELLKVVGKGSFGKVLQVRKRDTGRIYAMKVLTKKDIVERREIKHTLSERNVLANVTSPFVVGLKFSFQTPEKLYLVLDYMNGGELFYHLQKETAFSEQRAKFYTCELTLALEHLHKYNIIYRDLKPENILLDSNGHISLTDFGLCKENVGFFDTTNTFCGTAEYLAPEVLTGRGYGHAVDWWSLGILFFEMTTGLPPFYSENTNLMYKKILHNQLVFPVGFSTLAQSLVRGLLERDPSKRLGGGSADAKEVKRHPFFDDVDWQKLLKKQILPPFKPKVASEADTSNFDPTFTEALPVDSLPKSSTPLSETMQQNFKGFTYTDDASALHYGSSIGNQ